MWFILTNNEFTDALALLVLLFNIKSVFRSLYVA